MGPFSGPESGPLYGTRSGATFRPQSVTICPSPCSSWCHNSPPIVRHTQAFAAWQWWQYCRGELPVGKAALRINLDETSVCLFQGGSKGTVFVTKTKKPKQKVSRAKRRACLTHVGLICDRPAVQVVLPQVVIGNRQAFLVKELVALKAACPPNVYLLKQKSAWNNVDTMIYVIRLLGAALAPYTHEVQPVLFLDACRLHLSSKVIAACHEANIWLVVIPAQMTWLLQPLDTHAFFMYKLILKTAYQAARADTEDGNLHISSFLRCLYQVIRRVLQGRCWSLAFDQDGFGADSGQCRPSTKQALELDVGAPVAILAQCPTEEQFQLCFPRKAKISTEQFLKPFFVGPVVPPRALPGSRSMLQDALAPGVIPGEGRTRGEKKRRAEDAEARDSGAAASSGSASRPVLARGVGPVLPRGVPIAFLKDV